jgi:hypothetical protein
VIKIIAPYVLLGDELHVPAAFLSRKELLVPTRYETDKSGPRNWSERCGEKDKISPEKNQTLIPWLSRL